MRCKGILIGIIFLSASGAFAESFDSYVVAKLSYGVNKIDFNNDGIKDLIVLARRENFNAHGFDVVTFYSEEPGNGVGPRVLGLVSVFDEGKESFTLGVSGGADCIMHDFRLLIPKKGHEALLIIANRKMSESYLEENQVTFRYYKLKYNDLGVFGAPYLYFQLSDVREAKAKYCDVNDAFKSELGLGGYRNIP